MIELKPGTIFCSHWGYDQTNIDFYEVVKTTKTMVYLRAISSAVVGDDHGYANLVVPDATQDAPRYSGDKKELLRRKVRVYGDDVYVSINSFASASIWDGKPKSETALGYGH